MVYRVYEFDLDSSTPESRTSLVFEGQRDLALSYYHGRRGGMGENQAVVLVEGRLEGACANRRKMELQKRYEEGYEDGRRRGHEDGFYDGRHVGYEDGYEDGYSDALEEMGE